METIDGCKLLELIKNQNTITNKEIELNYKLHIDVSKFSNLKFINCNFKGEDLNFKSLKNKEYIPPRLKFEKCNFYIDIFFSDCNIKSTYFKLVYIKDSLTFFDVNLDVINFSQKCKIGIFELNMLNVADRLRINKDNIFERLLIYNSEFKNNTDISNSTFNDLEIINSTFNASFNFSNNIILEGVSIDRSSFYRRSIIDSNKFISEKNNFNLVECVFNDITSFSRLKANEIEFVIRNCNFEKLTRINNSIFKTLHIEQTNFNEISSFQDTSIKSIFIDRTNFDKTAFFDDISISDINNCNKRTLRNIKHQLQKANNKIDFDRFNSYEISAYREELKKDKKFWYNDKDAFILCISNLFSNNATNWFKALIVTVIGSFIFYSLFFWININSFHLGNFDFSKIDSFVNGFSKFLIPTNIYNPLIDRNFVTGWSFFPFILGKIFLSIGIYEVIVSFRKFKS
jgi:hypothetical protein